MLAKLLLLLFFLQLAFGCANVEVRARGEMDVSLGAGGRI